MHNKGKNIILLYEPKQVSVMQEYLTHGSSSVIVALDFEVELELKSRGISFVPLADIANSPKGKQEPLQFARDLGHDWYRLPELSFFEHKGILLGEQTEGVTSYYFEALLYYLILLSQVFDHFHPQEVIIFESSHRVPPAADPAVAYKLRLPVDISRVLAKQRHVVLRTVPTPLAAQARGRACTFARQTERLLFWLITRLVNTITSLRPRRRLRILATDPWSRIESIYEHLPDAEIIFTRRAEMRAMGWRNIWRTRAHFYHQLDYASRYTRRLAAKRANNFSSEWEAVKKNPSFIQRFVYNGISFWDVAKLLLEHLVTRDSANAVALTESAYRMLTNQKINRVLLFSSTKGFYNLLASVAELSNIPSIELQHAVEVVDPEFRAHARLAARYLAAYGALTKKHYEAFGVEPWRIVECGSPRFDIYQKKETHQSTDALRGKLNIIKPLSVLALAPHIDIRLEPNVFDSYGAWSILTALAKLEQTCPWAQLLLRPRPGSIGVSRLYQRPEVQELFSPEMRIVQKENLQDLLGMVDIVVAGSSTVFLETMLMHRPVIAYLPDHLDSDLKEYEDAGAVLVARSPEDLISCMRHLQDAHNRATLVERADAFLRSNFMPLLDGKSAERVAKMLHRLVTQYCAAVDLTKEVTFSKSVRYEIRAAQRDGLVVQEVPFDDFRAFYSSIVTVKKTERVWQGLKKENFAFMAFKGDIPISGAAFKSNGSQVYYSMAVSNFSLPEARHAAYLLQAEVIRTLRGRGYTLYVLGTEDTYADLEKSKHIWEFKKQFGELYEIEGKDFPFEHYRKVVSSGT